MEYPVETRDDLLRYRRAEEHVASLKTQLAAAEALLATRMQGLMGSGKFKDEQEMAAAAQRVDEMETQSARTAISEIAVERTAGDERDKEAHGILDRLDRGGLPEEEIQQLNARLKELG